MYLKNSISAIIKNLVRRTIAGYIHVTRVKLFIETIDSECLIASTNIDSRDSLFGACHVLRIVGKKAIRSIAVARITDHTILLASTQGKIETIASIKHILSNLVMSLVPYLNERKNVQTVSTAAIPVAQEPGPPPETHCPRKAIVVTTDHISQVYLCGLVLPRKISRI